MVRRVINVARWKVLSLVRFSFGLMGKSWNDFYAWMLDYQDRKVTLDQILGKKRNDTKFKGLWDWWRGEYCVEFMVRHGLKPGDTLLDYGCGYGRVTIPALRFQQGGHYIGTEISARRLELARQWVEREALSGSSYELRLTKDNSISYLEDRSVDAIWVLSVFNHMPDEELVVTLEAMRRIIRDDGVLFAYYVLPVEKRDAKTLKTFRRSDDEMTVLLSGAGFRCHFLDDWNDDLGDRRDGSARMCLCRPQGGGTVGGVVELPA